MGQSVNNGNLVEDILAKFIHMDQPMNSLKIAEATPLSKLHIDQSVNNGNVAEDISST